MNLERKTLQVGATAIICALLLRLGSSGFFNSVAQALSSPEATSLLLYLETGRIVHPPQVAHRDEPEPTEPQVPETTQTPTVPSKQVTQASFSAADAAYVEVNSVCGYDTDLTGWLQQPLSWDLTQDGPTVLILHSHATESFTQTEDYTESSVYRTLDTDYNIVSVGERLAAILEAGGIQVIHDKTLHDQPSFSSAYGHARNAIKDYLEQYPSIKMVLDLHRDAVENSNGDQLRFVADVDGQPVAQLMMVVGTDANGLRHPQWQENMALAVKLHAQLEKTYPGICRPISFRKQRFNQDLSTGAMLIEVGAAGNTRQEALDAAQLLAEAIVALSAGTATLE